MKRDEYSNEKIGFKISDIGSEILRRFSDDMYTSESIIREMVKNATDSYYQLEQFCNDNGIPLPKDYIEKKVHIDVEDDSVFILDEGIGCDYDDIRKLIQIAISDKPNISGATGFRGIGFWAAFSAGEKIIVESSKYGISHKYLLEVDTQKIREKIGPTVHIGEIMNDEECISLKSSKEDKDRHYTLVQIECKKTPGKDVDQKENRLYSFIHAKRESQEDFVRTHCSISLPDRHPLLTSLEQWYKTHNIPVVELWLNKVLLRKKFSEDVTDFEYGHLSIPILVKGVLKQYEVAKYWVMRSKERNYGTQAISGMSGIRLYKDSYPVGGANIFSADMYAHDSLSQLFVLDHYVGEIHITYRELTADANGENLVDGQYKRDFIAQVRALYQKLIDNEVYRSSRLARLKKFIQMKSEIEILLSAGARPTSDQLRAVAMEAESLLQDFKRNNLGKEGPYAKNHKRKLDRLTEIRREANALKVVYQKCKKAYPQISKIIASAATVIQKIQPRSKKRPIAGPASLVGLSGNGADATSEIDKKIIKQKIEQLIINRLKDIVGDMDIIKNLLKEIDDVLRGC